MSLACAKMAVENPDSEILKTKAKTLKQNN